MGNTFWKFVLTFLVVLLVLFGVVGVVVYFTRDNTDTPPSSSGFEVTYEGNGVASGSSLGLMDGESAFEVDGTPSYEVHIYVYCAAGQELEFSMGGEPILWSDCDGTDVTSGFTITPVQGGFTLKHYGFNDIMSRVYGGLDVELIELSEGDIFRMEITSQDGTCELYFTVDSEVIGIELPEDNYII